MEDYFNAAIENVYRHGDTDIFPFPIENRIVYDQRKDVVSLLMKIHTDFERYFVENPPDDIRSLVAVNHTGFRWANQIDPIWNLFILGYVLSVGEKIEDARLGTDKVFSYRINRETYLSGSLFRKDVTWNDFTTNSLREAGASEYIVACDIADCYSRISRHKLENSLRLVGVTPIISNVLIKYLSYSTGTRSSGLPVGGPAARIISELSLNNSDQFLFSSGLKFFRYADDYHVFCQSKKDAA